MTASSPALRSFLLLFVLLFPILTTSLSYDRVWNYLKRSDEENGAMTGTKAHMSEHQPQQQHQGLVLRKDFRQLLKSGLPNEDVRTNVALNLEGI